MNFDAITVGNVTQDIFLISKAFRNYDHENRDSLILPFTGKIDVPDVVYETGGFAGNCAVTMARQGLKVACMGKVGADSAGREIMRVLEKETVNTELMKKNAKHHSALTTILKPYNGDRTQLIHRGTTFEYEKTDMNFKTAKTKWVYIGSLSGNFKLLREIIDWAKKVGAKIAINPGPPELQKSRRLVSLLARADLVVVNRLELENLTHFQHPQDCLRRARQAGMRNIVMTDGAAGAWVLDEGFIYQSGIYKKNRVVDRTGAGDAYSAAYLASRIRGEDVTRAMSIAAANATSVVGYLGAKAGVLCNTEVSTMKIKQNYV